MQLCCVSFLAVLIAFVCLVGGQTLIQHYLQLNKEFPTVKSSDQAVSMIGTYLEGFPRAIGKGTFSCSEHSDPRLFSLCRYISVKHQDSFGEIRLADSGSGLDAIAMCVKRNENDYPKPLYSIVGECQQQLFAAEDVVLRFIATQFKVNSAESEYWEGICTLVRDLRPMSFPIKVLVYAGLSLSIGLIAFCIYRVLFGGDYLLLHGNEAENIQ